MAQNSLFKSNGKITERQHPAAIQIKAKISGSRKNNHSK
jgi:hypothetical protein